MGLKPGSSGGFKLSGLPIPLWVLPSAIVSAVPILHSLDFHPQFSTTTLPVLAPIAVWINPCMLLAYHVAGGDKISGLRWLLVGSFALALLYTVAIALELDRVAESAVTAVSWLTPVAFLGVGALRRVSAQPVLVAGHAASLFGEIGEFLDRHAVFLPISGLLAWVVVDGLGGNGIGAAVDLCAALMTPGMILAWPALWSTSAGLLSKRRVANATPNLLAALPSAGTVVFQDPACLVTADIHIVGLVPSEGTSSNALVAIAVALHEGRPGNVARALLEYGVSHHIRFRPASGVSVDEAGIVRGSLPDPMGIVMIGPLEAMLDAGFDASTLDEHIAHHRGFGRMVLLVAEAERARATLGAIFLGHPPRNGASEAVRRMKASGLNIAVRKAVLPLPGAEASLRQLKIPESDADNSDGNGALLVRRPGGEPIGKTWRGIALTLGAHGSHVLEADGCRIGTDDPRAIPDLLRFAAAFLGRRRIVATILAAMPLMTLALLSSRLAPPAQAISIAALVGLILAVGTPQALRWVPWTTNYLGHED